MRSIFLGLLLARYQEARRFGVDRYRRAPLLGISDGSVILYFLGGVHGTGKTTLALELGAELGATVLSASQLIRLAGVEPSTLDKRVEDISGNQALLLRGLAQYRTANASIILDGHYCVRSISGEPTRIDLGVFREMAPTSLLLLEDDASAIARRLLIRDGVAHNIMAVLNLMDYEREAARAVSEALGLKLCILRTSDGVRRAADILMRGGE